MDRDKLAQLLNEDLRRELKAVFAYLHQYAVAPGLRGEELREILGPEIAAELEHAKFLAEKIYALGGNPAIEALPFEPKAEVKEMIAYDLELEKEAIAAYVERVEQARAYGDVGLAVQLEQFVADETTHKERFERLLRGFTEL